MAQPAPQILRQGDTIAIHSHPAPGLNPEDIAREPALQYLGPDNQEVSIKGTIYPRFRGGLHQIEQIRHRAANGTPMMMVDGPR